MRGTRTIAWALAVVFAALALPGSALPQALIVGTNGQAGDGSHSVAPVAVSQGNDDATASADAGSGSGSAATAGTQNGDGGGTAVVGCVDGAAAAGDSGLDGSAGNCGSGGGGAGSAQTQNGDTGALAGLGCIALGLTGSTSGTAGVGSCRASGDGSDGEAAAAPGTTAAPAVPAGPAGPAAEAVPEAGAGRPKVHRDPPAKQGLETRAQGAVTMADRAPVGPLRSSPVWPDRARYLSGCCCSEASHPSRAGPSSLGDARWASTRPAVAETREDSPKGPRFRGPFRPNLVASFPGPSSQAPVHRPPVRRPTRWTCHRRRNGGGR